MIREAKSSAIDSLKGNVLQLFLLMVVLSIPVLLTVFAQMNLTLKAIVSFNSNLLKLSNTLYILIYIFSIIASLGFAYASIHIANHSEVPTIGDTFRTACKNILKKLGVLFLVGLAIQVGLVLFIIPGIIVSLGLSFSTLILFDEDFKELSIFETISTSWRLTTGYKKTLFKFMLSALGFIFINYLLTTVAGLLLTTVVGSLLLSNIAMSIIWTACFAYIQISLYNLYKAIKEDQYYSNSEDEDEDEDEDEFEF